MERLGMIVELNQNGFVIDTDRMDPRKIYAFQWQDRLVGVMKDDDGTITWFNTE